MSADPVADTRVRPEPPKTYYEDVVQLPGFGFAPERCRGLEPAGHCAEGHTILGRSSCGVRRCPDHWRDWVEKSAVGAVAKLAAYRHAQEGAGKRLCHVVASPPQDRRYSADQLFETRSEAYEAMEAAGVRGGTVVTHPYRGSDRGEMLWETANEHGEVPDGMGKWRWFREASDGWADLTRLIEASPHYHALAAVEDVQPEDAPDEWVIERVRTFDRFHYHDTESYRDMAKAVYYTLTHGAYQDGRATRTYFGEVASFSPEEELTATEWDRIQREAERAVTGRAGDALDSGEEAEQRCPRDGCEAEVLDLYGLRERLESSAFKEAVLSHRDGRRRWRRLHGLLAWAEDRVDRPPPHAAGDEAQLLRWLEEVGRDLQPGTQQSGLEAYAD